MATNKTVFFLIGILLIVLGASMLAPYVLQVVLDEGSHSFISSSFVTIFIGILFVLANLEKEFKLNLRQTFLFSSLAWLMVALFGSLPFVLATQEFSFSEAFFESMSGITTTGSTIIPNLESIPKGILFWRAILQAALHSRPHSAVPGFWICSWPGLHPEAVPSALFCFFRLILQKASSKPGRAVPEPQAESVCLPFR